MSNLKVAKKGKYVPVKDLDAEQLAKRRADELRRKQGQRAKKVGKTLDQYRENIVKKDTVRRERREASLWEREIQANERNIRRGNQTVGRQPKQQHSRATLPDIGKSIGRAKKEIRKLLGRKILTDEELGNLVITNDKGRVLPIEGKKVYGSVHGHLNRWEIDGSNYKDPVVFLERCKTPVKNMIDEVTGSKKVSLRLEVLYVKETGDEDREDDEEENSTMQTAYRSGTSKISDDEEFETEWPIMVTNLLTSMSEFQKNGSGWVIEKLIRLEINADHYNPLAGRSWIPLPKSVGAKKAVVNLKNNDDNCFQYAVAAAKILMDFPDMKNLERIPGILKTRSDKLNMSDIPSPTKLEDISKFEKQNSEYNINVFTLDENDEVIPLRVKRRTEKDLVNVRLLLWGDMNKNWHYSPIKNMSKLVASQISTRKAKKFFCDNCCNWFGSHELLGKHEEICYSMGGQRVILEEGKIKFDNVRNTQRVPFAIYADTEAYNIKCDATENTNTVKLSEQTFNDGGYVIVGPDGYETKYKKYDDIVSYVAGLVADAKEIRDLYFTHNADINMTDDDEENYRRSDKCYKCGWHLVDGENKNRDHDHFTGKYRGAACRKCNLAMKKPRFIPVFFHNLEGYDSHMIIREIARSGYGKLSCLPKNNEQYISFSLKLPAEKDANDNVVAAGIELRFLDSFKFLLKGLGNLVKTLNPEDFVITRDLTAVADENLSLLRRKGVYPYDWVDGPDKMLATELPPIEKFFNTLSESECDEEDYEHAQNVWRAFGCETFQDYHDLYLKTDILFLADIFEKFRKTATETYGLDPAWNYTTPGLAWDAALKMTGVRLDTVGDIDKHLFIERATRGGISMISKRHAVANHKYMKNYDPEKPSTFIMYNDENNLYGGAMTKNLPTGDLKWMTDDELTDSENLPCFLEVDVEYPRELHDDHNDYPFLCEKMVINGVTKLVPNLGDKKNYVCHYSELKLAVKHGLRITKIHRGLKFSESPWLQKYIEFNTKLRSVAKSTFEKDFYKLMNNSVFGKTIENVRNRVDVQFATTKKRLNDLIGMPNYTNSTNFENGPEYYFTAVNLGKPVAKLNKPIYVGAAVLSISKCRMYEFFYEYAKPKWGNNVKLLFTDTDSLCLEIRTEDYFRDTKDDVAENFDTSEYPKDHPAVAAVGFPVGMNKKKLFRMKDECKGENVVEFVGLRPKMYAIKKENGDEIKKDKGTKTYVIEKRIRFEDYKRCLFEDGEHYEKQNLLRNRNHKMYVERTRKKALSGDDDKRVILPGNVDTLAIGHWRSTKVALTADLPVPGNTGSLYDLSYRKLTE